MAENTLSQIQALLASGTLSQEQQRQIAAELRGPLVHHTHFDPLASLTDQIYGANDLVALQTRNLNAPHYRVLRSLDELLERDEQREEDGFKRKVRLGKVAKPADTGRNRIVIVPTTVEEKFYHDTRVSQKSDDQGSDDGDEGDGEGELGATTGTADGEEGDIIGEIPLDQKGEGDSTGAGEGGGEGHDIGSSAYELGKVLTERFQLPNLKEKGKKKRSLTRYVYDLTDTNRGSGQILDKKRTLTEVIKTNIALGRINPDKPIDPQNLLITPRDRIYRILSREKDVESQAMVFFLRDYSGSMAGRPTEIVCSLHVMLYSWLMYQYQEQVVARFILHDTEAKEVEDFYKYHNTNVAGGTKVMSSIELVNKLVREENLARDYNLYVFYGGDGDDWQTDEDAFVAAFEEMYSYVNRIGITIVKRNDRDTAFETFLDKFNLIENHEDLARLSLVEQDIEDSQLVEEIRELIST